MLASSNSSLFGHPEAMAKWMRRTLVRTCALKLQQLEAQWSRRRHRRTGCGADRHGVRYRREHRPWLRTTCGVGWPAWWPTRRDRRTARTARHRGSRPAAGAVELFVEGTRVVGDAATPERGDDKARIEAPLERVLGLPTTRACGSSRRSCNTGKSRKNAPAGPRRHRHASPRQAD